MRSPSMSTTTLVFGGPPEPSIRRPARTATRRGGAGSAPWAVPAITERLNRARARARRERRGRDMSGSYPAGVRRGALAAARRILRPCRPPGGSSCTEVPRGAASTPVLLGKERRQAGGAFIGAPHGGERTLRDRCGRSPWMDSEENVSDVAFAIDTLREQRHGDGALGGRDRRGPSEPAPVARRRVLRLGRVRVGTVL